MEDNLITDSSQRMHSMTRHYSPWRRLIVILTAFRSWKIREKVLTRVKKKKRKIISRFVSLKLWYLSYLSLVGLKQISKVYIRMIYKTHEYFYNVYNVLVGRWIIILSLHFETCYKVHTASPEMILVNFCS